jgi:hypothetical protein
MRYPPSSLLCGPPTPLSPSAACSGHPLQTALLGPARSFFAKLLRAQPVRCARGRHRTRRRLVTGSPLHRLFPERDKGLPGAWIVPFARAMVNTLRQVRLSCPYRIRRFCLRGSEPVGHLEYRRFRSRISHGSRVRVSTLRQPRYRGRRKTRYRLVWVHLAGRDSHPPDDDSEFQEIIASLHPF